VTVGTSAAVRCVIESEAAPALPAGLWNYRISKNRHLVGGALTDAGSLYQVMGWCQLLLHLPLPAISLPRACGPHLRMRSLSKTFEARSALLQWFQANVAGGDSEAMWPKVEALEADAHGLTVLPFLSGERSTGWRGDATLTFHGVNRFTEAHHLIRAGVEAVVLRLAVIVELLGGLVDGDAVLVAAGGPLENVPLWSRMVADAMDRPLLLVDAKEITSRGVAVLMCESLTGEPAPELPIKSTVWPEPAAVKAYAAAIERNSDLYAKLYARL
jgi:gluconokinase